MKRDLPYYIARFLLVRPELNIPGFGRFYSTYKSASFAESEIHPPSYSREFSPSPKSNDIDDFCDFLKYQTGRGEASIKKTVKNFIAELKKGAKRKAGIPIEGLGTFTLMDGKIHAEIDNNTFGHHFSGFPNVDSHALGSLISDPARGKTEDKSVSLKENEQVVETVLATGIAISIDEDSATSTSDHSAIQQEAEESELKEKVEEGEADGEIEENELKEKIEESELMEKVEESEVDGKIEESELKEKVEEGEEEEKIEENELKEKVEEGEAEDKIEEEEVSVPLPIVVPADHTSVRTIPVPVAQKTSYTQTITKAAPTQIHSRRSGLVDSTSQNYRSLFWLLGIILLLLVISAFLLLTDVLDGGSKAKYSQDKEGTPVESDEGSVSGTSSEQKSTKDIQDELESSLSPTGSKQGSSEVSGAKGETRDNAESGVKESETGESEINPETDVVLHESGKTDVTGAGSTETGVAGNMPGKGKDCMVVVGAFRVLSNVDRMEARLTQMGYQPYTEVRKGLTHVGVLTPCRTSDLRKVLYRGRAEIDGGAWVLRVHGTPPDQEM